MDITWLLDFLAVADSRSFSKAAQARHATQSAVSRRVKSLEDWYGVTLIDRSTYPVALTRAGADLVPIARELSANLYRSRNDIHHETASNSRQLHFTMPHTLASSFFPVWWQDKRREHDLQATVTAADFWECVQILLSADAHFLLCYSHPEFPNHLEHVNLRQLRIGHDVLIPVCATDDTGQPRYRLASDEAQPILPLLAYPDHAYLGKVVSGVLTTLQAQCATVRRYESAFVESVKAEALLGEGVAWLPHRLTAAEVSRGQLTYLGDESHRIALDIWLCCPATTHLPSHAEALFASLTETDAVSTRESTALPEPSPPA